MLLREGFNCVMDLQFHQSLVHAMNVGNIHQHERPLRLIVDLATLLGYDFTYF